MQLHPDSSPADSTDFPQRQERFLWSQLILQQHKVSEAWRKASVIKAGLAPQKTNLKPEGTNARLNVGYIPLWHVNSLDTPPKGKYNA